VYIGQSRFRAQLEENVFGHSSSCCTAGVVPDVDNIYDVDICGVVCASPAPMSGMLVVSAANSDPGVNVEVFDGGSYFV
jgi:hypothetical protein